MNVLVLTPALYNTSPGFRFRIEQWGRYLEREGVNFTFVPFVDERLQGVLYQPGYYTQKAARMLWACLRRLLLLRKVKSFDVVWVPREAALIGPGIIEWLVRALGVPLVYDFDDPIWLPYRSPTNSLFSRLKWPSKTAAICRLADRVVVGNRLLADWARQHATCVEVVPSTIDLEQYTLPVESANVSDYPRPGNRRRQTEQEGTARQTDMVSVADSVMLGWTGSHSTLPFLELLEEPLKKLAALHRYRLLVISHTDRYRMPSVPIEVVSKQWNAAREAFDLHEMDIGLGPFPDRGWTPWRCHGKVLQYMAAGIPCVVSRLGILPDYIQDGINGFLADSEEEWVDKISRLIQDESLRKRLGQAGRRTIEDRYSAAVWAPCVRQILQDVARKSKTPSKKQS